MDDIAEVRPSRLRTFYYWTVLLVTLVILDDLVFGWIFWALSQVNLLLSVTVAFLASWAYGYWLTVKGLSEQPGRVAALFLDRFQLERNNPELEAREEQLLNKITSIGVAIPMTLLVGGIVSTLWLVRRGILKAERAYRIGLFLTAVYAVEFALIHGFGIGGSIFFVRQ